MIPPQPEALIPGVSLKPRSLRFPDGLNSGIVLCMVSVHLPRSQSARCSSSREPVYPFVNGAKFIPSIQHHDNNSAATALTVPVIFKPRCSRHRPLLPRLFHTTAIPGSAYLIRNATHTILYLDIEAQPKIRRHISAGRSLESGIWAFGWKSKPR